MLSNQRIRWVSWGLSLANVLGGLALFVLARKLSLDLAALKPSLLGPTRLFLWVNPWGWLAFTCLSSVLLLAGDHTRLRPHWIARGMAPASWIVLSAEVVGVVCFVVVAFFQPICTLSSHIAQP